VFLKEIVARALCKSHRFYHAGFHGRRRHIDWAGDAAEGYWSRAADPSQGQKLSALD
jgi:hypothetical protein